MQLTKRQHYISQLEDCKVLFLITTSPNTLARSKVKLMFKISILNKTRAAASQIEDIKQLAAAAEALDNTGSQKDKVVQTEVVRGNRPNNIIVIRDREDSKKEV